MKRKNRKTPYTGLLARLTAQSVYKRHAHNKLRGFWRGLKQRGVMRPLQAIRPTSIR